MKKVALVNMNVVASHPHLNFKVMLTEIKKAKSSGQELILFPEMALSGYFIGDRFESDAFLRDITSYNEELRLASVGITAVWGSVDADFSKKGCDGRTRKYNAAFVACDGEWISNGVCVGKTYKTLLPEYREFDDARYFHSLDQWAKENHREFSDCFKPFPIMVEGNIIPFGITICEDVWNDDYSQNPVASLVANGAQAIINISCSPWTWQKNKKRERVLTEHVRKHQVPLLYCNAYGVQNNGKNLFFLDGGSQIYDPKVNVDVSVTTDDNMDLYQAITSTIRQFVGNQKIVLGLSGGIDSALVATLCVEALGPNAVTAVNMPTAFNSQTTIRAAETLAKNLKINCHSIPIETLVATTQKLLQNAGMAVSDFVLENIQSRHRGSTVLAAIAASLNAIFTNNGNKTETALGYATLYGDVNGAFAPIADLYKHQVYDLARFINKKNRAGIIPEICFTLPPSAELSAAQNVDEGKGDPIFYEYHDFLVQSFIENRSEPEDILLWYQENKLEEKLGIDLGVIAKYFKTPQEFIVDLEEKWTLYQRAIFKRIQAPPIITVSKRSFGFDLRESQNGTHFTQKYLELRCTIK